MLSVVVLDSLNDTRKYPFWPEGGVSQSLFTRPTPLPEGGIAKGGRAGHSGVQVWTHERLCGLRGSRQLINQSSLTAISKSDVDSITPPSFLIGRWSRKPVANWRDTCARLFLFLIWFRVSSTSCSTLDSANDEVQGTKKGTRRPSRLGSWKRVSCRNEAGVWLLHHRPSFLPSRQVSQLPTSIAWTNKLASGRHSLFASLARSSVACKKPGNTGGQGLVTALVVLSAGGC